MIELYQEAIDGHKHEWEEELEWETKWHDKVSFQFMGRLNYRIKKDKIEEAAEAHVESYASYWSDEKELAKKAFISGWEACLKDRDNNND